MLTVVSPGWHEPKDEVAARGRSRRRTFLVAAGLLVSIALSAGCSSSSMDLVNDYCAPTGVRLPAEKPLGSCWVRLKQDRRPYSDYGKASYLGESNVLDQRFRVPVAESILSILARDVRLAGLFSPCGLYERDQQFRIDVTLERAGASYVEGLPSLIPVIPASSVEATVKLRLTVVDRDGRQFLDETFEDSSSKVVAAVEGLEGAAAEALGETIRKVVDRAIPAVSAAHVAFWERLRPGAP